MGFAANGVAVGLAAILAACAHSVLGQPVAATGGAWSIEVDNVLVGQDQFGTATRTFTPERGLRFIWVNVKLVNTSQQKRRFNWDRCDLDDAHEAYVPSLVTRRGAIAPEVEIVEPGGRLERLLIFTFPEEKWPTRLKCGDVNLPLMLNLQNQPAGG